MSLHQRSLQQRHVSHFRLIFAAFAAALLLSACGGGKGSAAPAPSGGITATPGDTQVTVSWASDPGVEYWLFYAPGNSLSSATLSKVSGVVSRINVTSPYTVTGLTNGSNYIFLVNGRVGEGQGGPDSTALATPRLAGTSWTAIANQPFGSNDMRGLAYGTTTSVTTATYVAVGSGGVIYSSTDTATWTAITSSTLAAANPNGYKLNAVGSALNKYIAVGEQGTIVYTTDLSGWAASPIVPTKNALNAVATNGTYIVAVGNNGTILASTDALTWSNVALPGYTDNLYAVMYTSSGTWFAAGANGALFSSSDGVTWVARSSGTGKDLKGASYLATSDGTTITFNYVIVGSGGTVLTSSDGVAWTARTMNATADLNAVVASNQYLAVSEQGGAYTSPDGITWTSQNTHSTAPLYALLKPANVYLALGKAGTALLSQ